jgi:hypothetical protein
MTARVDILDKKQSLSDKSLKVEKLQGLEWVTSLRSGRLGPGRLHPSRYIPSCARGGHDQSTAHESVTYIHPEL